MMMVQKMDIDCRDVMSMLKLSKKNKRKSKSSNESFLYAYNSLHKELSGTTTTSDQCSEQTASVCGGPVFEEFIPIKKSNNEEDGEHESPHEIDKSDVDCKKSDWLRSTHLWDHSPHPDTTLVVAKKARVVEVKPNNNNRGGFQPFQKETKRVSSETDLQPAVKAITPEPAPAPATTTCSTTEQVQKLQPQSQTHRKQRRCWSQELHRRFLHALQQLGGSHVATPKQIRDHMKVDGLTNDEVKSHLQKYRLHTRRPATSVTSQGNGNSQQPQFMVVEGIWVPSPQDFSPPSDVANNGDGVYAQVTALPPQSPKRSVERSSGRCNSPAASSSTNTNTTTTSASPVS